MASKGKSIIIIVIIIIIIINKKNKKIIIKEKTHTVNMKQNYEKQ